MHSVSIGVVVVAYRSGDTLRECLDGILNQQDLVGVAVVDNSPADDLRAECRRDSRISYLHRPDNPGFAVGCNIGAAALPDHTHIAFVNPDVTLIKPLAELAGVELQTTYSVVSGGLVITGSAHISNARRAVVPWRELLKAAVGSSAYVLEAPADGATIGVPQLDGALLLMSRDTFIKLGRFDERYELYYEDVDLCRAAGLRGGCAIVRDVYGEHVGGASSRHLPEPVYLAGRVSRVRFFVKWSRKPRSTRFVLIAISVVEMLCRTAAFKGEGLGVRLRGVRAQLQEIRSPGTTRCLPRAGS